jgi:hypothetical protein
MMSRYCGVTLRHPSTERRPAHEHSGPSRRPAISPMRSLMEDPWPPRAPRAERVRQPPRATTRAPRAAPGPVDAGTEDEEDITSHSKVVRSPAKLEVIHIRVGKPAHGAARSLIGSELVRGGRGGRLSGVDRSDRRRLRPPCCKPRSRRDSRPRYLGPVPEQAGPRKPARAPCTGPGSWAGPNWSRHRARSPGSRAACSGCRVPSAACPFPRSAARPDRS